MPGADRDFIQGGTAVALAYLSNKNANGSPGPGPGPGPGPWPGPGPGPIPGQQNMRDGSGDVLSTISRVVFGPNPKRTSVMVVNDGDDTVYICFSDVALAHTGIRLNSLGGSFILDNPSMWYGSISAISASATSKITAQEVYNR